MKKLDKWNSDVKRGFDYILNMWEEEQKKTETVEETKARHRVMANTADLAIELINQCPRCASWDNEKIKCNIHEKVEVNCQDWVGRKDGGKEE